MKKINSFNLSTMICALCCSSFYGVFSSYILHETLNSSLISLLIGYIFSLVISSLILKLFNIRKNEPFSEKLINIYGKLGKIIIIICILCSLFAFILLSYRLTTFISNQYLIDTKRYLILLMIIITTYYTASKGIETTLRVSTISFYISLIIFLFDLFSLIPQIKLTNLTPLIDVSFKKIIINSLLFSLYFTISTTQIYSIKRINVDNKFNKWFYIMISFSFFIIFSSVFTMIGVNSIKVTTLFDYPVYSTLKRIKLFSFLDSIENISILAWFYFILNSCSMFLFFSFNTIKDTFKLNKKKSKIINIIIIILLYLIPYFFFLNTNYNESYNYIYIPLIIEGIVLLIVILSLIKNRFK